MMFSSYRFFLFSFVSVVTACTMPIRPSYDRDSGSYQLTKSEQTTNQVLESSSDNADEAAWMEIIKPWLGTRYRYGKASRSGTDCSGYIMQIYKEKTGVSLPHSSRDMYKLGTAIDQENLQTGDLVFFGGHWGIDHVGLYLSNGNFTHASTSSGVIITPLSDEYWKARYKGARRLQ
ncbi:MAG: NlpC/P60 family protein [Fibrobacteraceae bacterium]|nr:NlpC/P60 family protein [Fibrobacteraceae bacterium]